MVSTLSLGSVLGGIWLWRDDERGYRITRTILALELAIIRLPMSSYTVLSGFYVGLFRTMDGPYVELGMKGALVFALSGSPPTLVGVNLFALAMLVLLLEARPMAAVALPRSNEFAQDKESPSDAQ